MHIPTYVGLFKVSVSLILCTTTRFALNIFDDIYVGFECVVDHRSYTHNLNSCEIKAWKKNSTGILRTHKVTSSQMAW